MSGIGGNPRDKDLGKAIKTEMQAESKQCFSKKLDIETVCRYKSPGQMSGPPNECEGIQHEGYNVESGNISQTIVS